MVLPFGLESDSQHGTGGNQPLLMPSAPVLMMRGQTNVSTVVPIIPSPYIDFIVVNGDDRYMIRCERKAVLENSVELAKLIHAGPNSGRRGDNHFQISNVDKYDFELVIRFLEKKFIKYRDHLHILKILQLADRYNCPDLIIHCIRELDLQLTSATVIDVFRSLWFYQSLAPDDENFIGYMMSTQNAMKLQSKVKRPPIITSDTAVNSNANSTSSATANPNTNSSKMAKPNSVPNSNSISNSRTKQNSTNTNPFTAEDFSLALLHNALQLIDMHAELVLTHQQITELRFEELEMIAKRDALQLSSELVLFNCLADWSMAECRRKDIDADAENRRRVLGPLCYAPRYLLMSMLEFQRACDRVELLDPVEIRLVTEALEGKKLKHLTNEQTQMLEKFRTPRPEFTKMPIHLSDRTNPKNYPRKMRRAEKNYRSGDEGCLEKFCITCLSVFICIFD